VVAGKAGKGISSEDSYSSEQRALTRLSKFRSKDTMECCRAGTCYWGQCVARHNQGGYDASLQKDTSDVGFAPYVRPFCGRDTPTQRRAERQLADGLTGKFSHYRVPG
jgi:hypothetical protein